LDVDHEERIALTTFLVKTLAEPLAVFPELSRIIIAFTVRSILKVEPIGTVGGFTIDEVSVPPYQKDYDVDAGGPSRWAHRFDAHRNAEITRGNHGDKKIIGR
jgi:hypothetical protein